MAAKSTNRRLFIAIGILVVLVGLCVYFYFDPSDSAFFPKCAFFSMTGYKCPGCGSQRAIHAMLHGDALGAIRYNAMLLPAIPVVVLLFVAEFNSERWPRFYSKVNSRWMIWGCFIMVTAWWIGRNIADW